MGAVAGNMKALYIAGAVALVYLGGKSVTKPTLKYFKPHEFGIWWPLMNNQLLLTMDQFRELWGYPVQISKAGGSLGRHGGDSKSQHNVDLWGGVKAADMFPMLPDGKGGYRYIQTADERNKAFQIAKQAGFTGIGIYTDTKPGNLLHGDVRDGLRVATWSRVAGEYKGIYEVLA